MIRTAFHQADVLPSSQFVTVYHLGTDRAAATLNRRRVASGIGEPRWRLYDLDGREVGAGFGFAVEACRILADVMFAEAEGMNNEHDTRADFAAADAMVAAAIAAESAVQVADILDPRKGTALAKALRGEPTWTVKLSGLADAMIHLAFCYSDAMANAFDLNTLETRTAAYRKVREIRDRTAAAIAARYGKPD